MYIIEPCYKGLQQFLLYYIILIYFIKLDVFSGKDIKINTLTTQKNVNH